MNIGMMLLRVMIWYEITLTREKESTNLRCNILPILLFIPIT